MPLAGTHCFHGTRWRAPGFGAGALQNGILEFLSAAVRDRAQDDNMHLNLAGRKVGLNFLNRPVAVSDVQKVGPTNPCHLVVVTCQYALARLTSSDSCRSPARVCCPAGCVPRSQSRTCGAETKQNKTAHMSLSNTRSRVYNPAGRLPRFAISTSRRARDSWVSSAHSHPKFDRAQKNIHAHQAAGKRG